MNYSYECKNCGVEFTITMSVKKYETVKIKGCPVCFSDRIKRDYENILGIHYKDGGFTKHVQEEE